MPPRRSLVAAACLCLLVARGHELVLADDVRYRLEVQVDGAVRTATLHTGEPYAAASARFCTPGTPAALCSAVHDRLKAVGPYVPTVRAVSPSANPPGDRTALLLHLCARSGASARPNAPPGLAKQGPPGPAGANDEAGTTRPSRSAASML